MRRAMSKFTLFVYFLCPLVFRGPVVVRTAEKMNVFRLPADAIPESYSVQFTPKFNGLDSTFSGVTKVVIIPTKSVKVFTLNVKELNFTSVTLQDFDTRRNVEIKSIVNVTENEQVEFHLAKGVLSGRRHLLSMSYEGKIRTDMSGLYLSSYEEAGVTK